MKIYKIKGYCIHNQSYKWFEFKGDKEYQRFIKERFINYPAWTFDHKSLLELHIEE